ncbi:MAG: hypothetical protein MZV64_11595 [Ignavibacteriales bacterium]|nr:hypothetical protein [Ignavibacteriales bacterium]
MPRRIFTFGDSSSMSTYVKKQGSVLSACVSSTSQDMGRRKAERSNPLQEVCPEASISEKLSKTKGFPSPSLYTSIIIRTVKKKLYIMYFHEVLPCQFAQYPVIDKIFRRRIGRENAKQAPAGGFGPVLMGVWAKSGANGSKKKKEQDFLWPIRAVWFLTGEGVKVAINNFAHTGILSVILLYLASLFKDRSMRNYFYQGRSFCNGYRSHRVTASGMQIQNRTEEGAPGAQSA